MTPFLQTIQALLANVGGSIVALIGGKPLTEPVPGLPKKDDRKIKSQNPMRQPGRRPEASWKLVSDGQDATSQYFSPLADQQLAGESFRHLEDLLRRTAAEWREQARRGSGRVVLFEQGSLADGRRFVFLKPLNDYGLLIEATPVGWRIHQANRVMTNGENVIMRSSDEPWDVVVLMQDRRQASRVYIDSARFRQTFLPWPTYEQRLLQSLTGTLMGL